MMRHAFVTSQGGPYSQFKRALGRRNFMVAWTLAAELPKLSPRAVLQQPQKASGRTYWTLPDRQIESSVPLARAPLEA